MKKEFHISAFVAAVFAALVLCGCHKLEYKVYDNPYVYIIEEGDKSQVETSTVSEDADNLVKTYRILLSSKAVDESITVGYDIIVGNGLTEGIDYEFITKGSSVSFLPGIYSIPIRIRFLKNAVDRTKDNSITISITSVSADIGMGVPGPAHRNRFHKVTKIHQ